MVYEFLWYNGETACYELMDFDPTGLSRPEIAAKAKACLVRRYGFSPDELGRVIDIIYLLDVESREEVR